MDNFLTELDKAMPRLVDGLWITVQATLLGALLALTIAFLLGFMGRSRLAVLRVISRTVVELLRGTSLYVQLFAYFYVPPVFGYQLAPLLCGVLALGLNYGAYGSEVVRGALNAVPKAQWEATVALNMTSYQRMRRVILPQAWVQMIPPFTNLLIQLLKCTPLLSLITMADLTFTMQEVRSASGDTVMSYVLLLVVYFILAYAFTLMMNALELNAKARLGQGEGLRGLFRTRTSVDAAGAVSASASVPAAATKPGGTR
jgi:polar amino acid transport system permease protein